MRLPRRSVHLVAVFAVTILASASTAFTAQARTLTFEQRVQAQRAIERVYYAHQIGASRSFDEAVPRSLLEKKVRTYLHQSDSLERIWKTPVTAEALRREKARIEAGSRMPERLQEIYAALGNDLLLIRETLVRAALVARLTRSFGSQDGGGGWASPPESFQSGSISSGSAASSLAAGCAPIDTWDNGILDDVPSPRSGHTAVWTGSEVIIWGGTGGGAPLTSGSRYDPVIDTWRSVSTLDAPLSDAHTAVWTGSEMIVWGSVTVSGAQTNSGGRYDPASDTWASVSTAGAPPPRSRHTAAWGDGLMVVWGGDGSGVSGRNDGGRYDPASDSWTPVSTAGSPAGRGSHTAIWNGDEMIVWGGVAGGSPSTLFNDGGRYDPASDIWQPITTTGAPASRVGHSAVWTGTEMIVWGGTTAAFTDSNTGGRYDPSSDSWIPTSTIDAPDVRQRHTAIWTGSRMIVWGGVNLPCCDFSEPRDTGGLYDPATDSWSPTSLADVPAPRDRHIAVWAGNLMIVWGGQLTRVGIFGTSATFWSSGGRYDPSSDTWTPTSTLNAPPGGNGHSTIWTGSLMIDWGGATAAYPISTQVNAGGRYDPALDTWTPTSSLGAPSPRSQHTAVWTGGEMIVWGGGTTLSLLDSGSRYDPIADTWTPVSSLGAPSARSRHAAVWAGTSMFVWGGSDTSGRTATGSLYDPVADAWTATSVVGAPTARSGPTSIWTGSEMVVWGGTDSGGNSATGGRYDPLSDSWLPTSPTNAPSRRSQHTAIWTGSRMVVWGGATSTSPFTANTGGLYDPVADVWTVTSTTGAPAARAAHTAVWTGSAMVVWGGSPGQSTGGRYDPGLDSWLATSTVGAPSGRSGHGAVWTGQQMLVWGGGTEFNGGRYNLAESPDNDMDGFTVCAGDCDDSASSVHPGAVELPGNPVDENCDGTRACDPSGFWRTRGHFASCVAHDCHRLVDEGRMTNDECSALISSATRSGVGARQRARGVPKPLEP